MREFLLWTTCLAAIATCLAGCATTPAAERPPIPTPQQRQTNLDSFEEVWITIRDSHWKEDMNGVNWLAIHEEFRPRVEAGVTRSELRLILMEMIERLGCSHYDIIPAELYTNASETDGASTPKGITGIELRIVDGQAVVFRVDAGSTAAEAGVRPGWLVQSVDGEEIEPALSEVAASQRGRTIDRFMLYLNAQARLAGPAAETVEVVFLDADQQTRSLTLDRRKRSGPVSQLGNMMPLQVRFSHRRLPENMGYFTFNIFADAPRLMKAWNEAMVEFSDCDGMVVDLRGNPGGTGILAAGMSGWFVDQNGLTLGTTIMRAGELNYPVNRRPHPFRGPVAVLIDELSASTSEVMAGGLRDLGRARLFGTLSAGAALPSYFKRLANDDVLQYAVAMFTTPAGAEIEGFGIQPDHETHLTREALLAGRDPVLEAAVDWLAAETAAKEE